MLLTIKIQEWLIKLVKLKAQTFRETDEQASDRR